MEYKDFIDRIRELQKEGESLFNLEKTHENPKFRKWRENLTNIIEKIEAEGFQIRCNVRNRSFAIITPKYYPYRKTNLEIYNMELQDTLNELENLIENFEIFKEPIRKNLESNQQVHIENMEKTSPSSKPKTNLLNKTYSLLKKVPRVIYLFAAIVTIIAGALTINHFLFGQHSDESDTQSRYKSEKTENNDLIANNYDRDTETVNDKRELYEENIYELPNKANHLNTKLDKDKFFRKFKGLLSDSTGYITDVYGQGFQILGDNRGIYYQVRIDRTANKTTPYIMCYFDNSWGQKLETTNLPFQIRFEGVIEDIQPAVRVWLANCELK